MTIFTLGIGNPILVVLALVPIEVGKVGMKGTPSPTRYHGEDVTGRKGSHFSTNRV